MNKFGTACLAASVALAGLSSSAWADGFRIKVQSAKAGGQGLAFAASADDPTTIAFNPAGLHQLDGSYLSSTNALIVAPGNEFDSDLSSVLDQEGDDQAFWVPSFFFSSDLGTEKWRVGCGIYSPFGLGRDWDDTGITNSVAEGVPAAGFARKVDRIDLAVTYVNPVVVYELAGEKLALSVGFIYAHSRLESTSKPVIALGPGGTVVRKLADLDQKLYGDGYTFNVGAHSNVSEKLRVGAYYRHKIFMDYDHGYFTATKRNTSVFGANAARFQTRLNADFSLPGTFGFGINYQATDELSAEVNVEYSTWSEFDRVDADMGSPMRSASGAIVVNDATLSSDPNFDDVMAVRVGLAYECSETLTVRAGYYYEESPQPEESVAPNLADSDKHALTVGATKKMGMATVDFAYIVGIPNDRDVENSTVLATQIPLLTGTWSVDPSHTIMVTATLKF